MGGGLMCIAYISQKLVFSIRYPDNAIYLWTNYLPWEGTKTTDEKVT